ncbi:regulatory protein RecX [Endothiovibrio diazotrophicus]
MDEEAEVDIGQVRAAAIRLLARREHSVIELVRKLRAKGYPENLVHDAVEALDEEGLVSDHRFTESFIHGRFSRGSGPAKIGAELARKGVGDEVVGELLDARDAQWNELAREVRRKRFGDPPPKEYRERARQMRFLQGRGFTAEQIRAALEDEED